MESFKSISDYPGKPCKLLRPEILASYDGYFAKVMEESKRLERIAQNSVIHFHNGR